MPAPANADEFVELIRKSGVVEEARLTAYLQQLQTNSGIPKDVARFAGRTVRDGILTNFQAEQFMLGKWKRFTIGKYKVLERIGSGGMGQVFLCEHKLMRRKVAVKVLPTAKAEDSSSLDRFYREARAVAALDHPNIVRAYDIDQDENLHFLVMEYVDGASFQDLIKKFGPMDVTRCCHYIYWSAIGLMHAHEAGLIHRDIKPGNILIDRAGTVKILDMGLARFFNDDEDMLTKKYDENVLGTADYLAPEQAIDSHSVDGRADIYSLGATFYFMLSGHQPFTDGTVAQKLIWHQTRLPKPIREERPDVPQGVAAIVEKMMAKDANDRYQNPMELAEALAPWIQTPIDPPPDKEMPTLSAAAAAVGGAPVSQITRQTPQLQQPKTIAPSGGSGTKQSGPGSSGRKSSGSPRSSHPSMPAIRPSTTTSDSEQTRRRTTAAPVVEKMPVNAGEPAVWETLSAETNDAARANTERPIAAPKSGKKPTQLEPMPLPDSGERPLPRRKKSSSLVPLVIIGLLLLAGGSIYGVYRLVFTSPGPKPNETVGPGDNDPRILTVGRRDPKAMYQRVKEALDNVKEGQRIVILDSIWEEELTITHEMGRRVKGVTIEGSGTPGTTWEFPAGQPKNKMIQIQGAAGLTIRNLNFKGNKDTNVGIIISGACAGLVLEDLTFSDLREQAIRFDNCHGADDSPVIVQRCQIVGNRSFLSSAMGILFQANSSVDNPKPINEFITIRDKRIEGTFSQDNKEAAIVFTGNASQIEISNNRIWQTGDGIYFKSGTIFRVRIENNTFHTHGTAIHFKHAGTLAQKQNINNQKIKIERNYFFKSTVLMKSDDNATLSPLNADPSDNARNKDSKEGVPSINSRTIDVDFQMNIDDDKTFLRSKKNGPLNVPGGLTIGAPPVE